MNLNSNLLVFVVFLLNVFLNFVQGRVGKGA